MSNIKFFPKAVTVLLIASIFFTACDVPDISKFTEQSTEMTRGIRKGVRDTQDVIKDLSVRNDLYNSEQLNEIKKRLEQYQKAVKPTLKVLDSLDAYLEALNTLAQANKKSGENAESVVNSVGNLVTAVSGIQIAGQAVNLAVGLGSLFEQFRTAKSFRKRVNAAALIIEGKTQVAYNGQTRERIVIKPCKSEMVNRIIQSADSKQVKEKNIADLGCGVIDLLKFNLEDLQKINNSISNRLYTDFRSKNSVVIGLHNQINTNNVNVESEMESIKSFENLTTLVREDYLLNSNNPEAIGLRVRLKDTLDQIYAFDSILENDIKNDLNSCGNNCLKMREILDFDPFSCPVNEDTPIDDCQTAANRDKCICKYYNKVGNLTSAQFNPALPLISSRLEARYKILSAKLDANSAGLQRINPTYSTITSELKTIKDKQSQLDDVLEAGIEALDTWADTHANLQVAINSDKPLSVSRLAAKVKQIWEILDSSTKG